MPGNEKTVTYDLGDGAKMEFVLIRPGSFIMGSDKGNADEKPIHKVIITKPFYLGKFEVTQAQYQAVMGSNPSYFKGEGNLPVETVS
jgi:formylglycine-generating enzyme required for sulfatase activity